MTEFMVIRIEIDNGFLDVFGKLEDPRREHRKLYLMAEILFVTLCSLICGAESWIDVERRYVNSDLGAGFLMR